MQWSLNGLSIVALGLGNTASAIQLGEESLRLSQEWSAAYHIGIRTYWLARAVLLSGDFAHDWGADVLAEHYAHAHGDSSYSST